MFQACKNGTNDDKVFIKLRNVNVKEIQVGLYSTITWTQKVWEKEDKSGNMLVLEVK
jgi:hypothetical protein